MFLLNVTLRTRTIFIAMQNRIHIAHKTIDMAAVEVNNIHQSRNRKKVFILLFQHFNVFFLCVWCDDVGDRFLSHSQFSLFLIIEKDRFFIKVEEDYLLSFFLPCNVEFYILRSTAIAKHEHEQLSDLTLCHLNLNELCMLCRCNQFFTHQWEDRRKV